MFQPRASELRPAMDIVCLSRSHHRRTPRSTHDLRQVSVKDAVPLFHTSTLAPLLETSATMVDAHASNNGLSIVGLYQVRHVTNTSKARTDPARLLREFSTTKVSENNLADSSVVAASVGRVALGVGVVDTVKVFGCARQRERREVCRFAG